MTEHNREYTLVAHRGGGGMAAIGPASCLLLGEEGIKRRVSWIVPRHPLKRMAFVVLRLIFGDIGRVPDWCRGWHGDWQVRFVAEPDVVVFQNESRQVCVRWEVGEVRRRLAASRPRRNR